MRIQAKHIMLTYSCPEGLDHPITSKEELQNFLKTISKYNGSVVCHELHESGKSHYHAAVKFEPKLTSRNSRLFDYMGVHPNIGTKDNWKAMVRYVTKGSDWITDNVEVDVVTNTRRAKDKTAESYTEAIKLASEGKVAEGIALLQRDDPVRFVLNGTQMRSNLQSAFNEARQAANPIIIMEQNWTDNAKSIDITKRINEEDYDRTHILVGTAGIGKTQLAKYLLQQAGCKTICVVRTAEQLKPHIANIDGFVFDELNANAPDVRGGRWTRESQIGLLDRVDESALPARYGDIIIPPHIKRVITTNVLDRAIDTNDEAILRRVVVHNLGSTPLYVK